MKNYFFKTMLILGLCIIMTLERGSAQENSDVKAEHGQIGNAEEEASLHTTHPDAQWFPDAGLGLFLHWGISSVRAMNISWPMIPGRPLAKKRISDPKEIERIVQEQDFELTGEKPAITPLEYWEMAKDFNPENYHPEVWLQKAKEAGFTYVVLTTKHHEGFALWPSKYGNFNTNTFMNGRDLIKDYVEAARNVGLKVGLYYSGPDWYFDQDYMDFFYYKVPKINPEFPELGPDLKPRTVKHSDKEVKKHEQEYARIVKGQVEELLTQYGKIDLIWFDGAPKVPNAREVITQERIRELQPGIVINPRMHKKGDFITFERELPEHRPIEDKQWAEFCNPWNGNWPYVKRPYKDLNVVLTDLVRCRAFGINYLLGIGPMADGNLASEAYENIDKLKSWMQKFGEAIHATQRLVMEESASVPAASKGNVRYLYIIPGDDGLVESAAITFKGANTKPEAVTLLSDGKPIGYKYSDGTITVQIPGDRTSKLVDVIKIHFLGK